MGCKLKKIPPPPCIKQNKEESNVAKFAIKEK